MKTYTKDVISGVNFGVNLPEKFVSFSNTQLFVIFTANKINRFMLSNNEILKKIRIALSLQQDDIIKILALSDFQITKGALGDLFRNEDNEGYMEAGDQILRHFLNGLIIYKRGPMKDPKPELRKERPIGQEKPVEKYFKKNETGLRKRGK